MAEVKKMRWPHTVQRMITTGTDTPPYLPGDIVDAFDWPNREQLVSAGFMQPGGDQEAISKAVEALPGTGVAKAATTKKSASKPAVAPVEKTVAPGAVKKARIVIGPRGDSAG